MTAASSSPEITAIWKDVLRRISLYDPVILGQIAASLQLAPRNARHLDRLHLLSLAAASLERTPGQRVPTADELDAILGSEPFLQLRDHREGCTVLPTMSVPTSAGISPLFQNPYPDLSFLYPIVPQMLANERHGEPLVDQETDAHLSELFRGVGFVLMLMGRASAVPIDASSPPAPPTIDLGTPAQRERLLMATVDPKENWEKIHAWAQLSNDALQDLVVPQGAVGAPASFDNPAGELAVHPLVDAGDAILYAAPGLLPYAVMNALAKIVDEAGRSQELQRRFDQELRLEAYEAMVYLGVGLVEPGSIPPLSPPEFDGPASVREDLFHLGDAVILHVLTASSNVEPLPDDAVVEPLRDASLDAFLVSRVVEVSRHLDRWKPEAEHRWLVLPQGWLRHLHLDLEVPPEAGPGAILPPNALALLSQRRNRDPAILLRYIEWFQRNRNQGRIPDLSLVGRFVMEQEAGTPATSGFGGDGSSTEPGAWLFDASRVASGVHWVGDRSGRGPALVELAVSPSVPVYRERAAFADTIPFLVEDLPRPVWFVPGSNEGEEPALSIIARNLAYGFALVRGTLQNLDGWQDLPGTGLSIHLAYRPEPDAVQDPSPLDVEANTRVRWIGSHQLLLQLDPRCDDELVALDEDFNRSLLTSLLTAFLDRFDNGASEQAIETILEQARALRFPR